MMVPRAAGLWQRVRSALTGPHSECLAHRTGTCSLEQSPRRIAGGERAYCLPYCPPFTIVFFKPFHFKMMMMSPYRLGDRENCCRIMPPALSPQASGPGAAIINAKGTCVCKDNTLAHITVCSTDKSGQSEWSRGTENERRPATEESR